ncbi:MAG: PilZ domain-containing protein [Rhodospirillales bacterium]|nr:PilZ domain-containing protein [Rhodospirillales bacterium]
MNYRGRLSSGVIESPCTVVNVSAGGAQVNIARKLETLSVATLAIEGVGAFHARVVWQQGDRTGLQFLDDVRRVSERLFGIKEPVA